MKKIYLLFSVIYFNFFYTQKYEQVDDNYPLSLLFRHFKNLNHGKDEFEKFPTLKQPEYYCIMGCIILIDSNDETLKKVALARLKGIATQLFREGKPVLLTSGMSSAYFNIEKNKNLEDDNNIIYLAIADCIISKAEVLAQTTFNNQTRYLIGQEKD